MISLPKDGHDADSILQTMRDLRGDDVDWRGGKVWSLVFHPGEDIADFVRDAYGLYFSENALNPTAFPSLKTMELEVVEMTASLLGGDAETAGNMTTGGTESLLMALKGAREWDKKRRPRAKRQKVVVPTTAHPAFDKAAHYFGLTLVHVPPGSDGRADVRAMERAIDSDTIMVVGSAPQYPHGVVDPIQELAAIAKKRGILMHVDACIGGFMLPFVRELGYDVPAFDLSVPGVTSLSVDLHKYGYAAKGASVLLYRSAELRKHMYFATADWPGGIYVSPTMTGTRPGGAIAAAWAIMHRLGHSGYLEVARKVMATATTLRDGINAIDGLHVVGAPHMSIMAIASDSLDVYEVGDVLAESGWHLDRQQSPPSLHLTVNHAHIDSGPALLADLAAAAARCQTPRRARFTRRVRDRAIRTVVGAIPSPVTSRLMPVASRLLGVGGGDGLPERSAPMYGLMATLPNRGDLRAMVIDILSDLTLRDSSAPRILDPQDDA